MDNTIVSNLNEVFKKLFNSVDKNVFEYLDHFAFIKSKDFLTITENVAMGNDIYTGMTSIAISISVSLVLYFVLKYFLAVLSNNKVENPYFFFIKLIIFTLLALNIKDILIFIINVNEIITKEILSIPFGIINKEVSFSTLLLQMNNILYSTDDSFSITSFEGIIKLYLTLGMLNLTFEYALRYIILKILFITAPVFAVLNASETTSKYFENWIRSFISMLISQNIVALILVMSIRIDFFIPNTVSKIAYIALVYALIKANRFTREIFGGVSLDIHMPGSRMLRI